MPSCSHVISLKIAISLVDQLWNGYESAMKWLWNCLWNAFQYIFSWYYISGFFIACFSYEFSCINFSIAYFMDRPHETLTVHGDAHGIIWASPTVWIQWNICMHSVTSSHTHTPMDMHIYLITITDTAQLVILQWCTQSLQSETSRENTAWCTRDKRPPAEAKNCQERI